MVRTITLKHGNHSLPQRFEPFYDGGHIVAENGYATVPAEDETHLHVLMLRGYNLTAEGQRLFDFNDLRAYIARSK